MDFGCCVQESGLGCTISGEIPNATYSDSLDSFDDRINTLNCDYRDVTPLFKAIEQEDWKGVLIFLTTGRWGNSALSSSFTHLEDRPPEHQARTWINCTGKKGELMWRQLPIHAAISYLAPLPVVQKLVELYRDGVRCADDTGNLPLHLAFGFGSSDTVVAFLIQEFPQALNVRGLQKRHPVDCCDLGPNKVRGDIIRACQDNVRSHMLKNWDQHWKKSLADAQERAGLEEPYLTGNKTIEEVFSEFMQVKLELQKTRDLARNRPTMIITKTEPIPIPQSPTNKSIRKSPSSDLSKIFRFGRKGNDKGGSSVAGSQAGSQAGSRATFKTSRKKKLFPPLGPKPPSSVAPSPSSDKVEC